MKNLFLIACLFIFVSFQATSQTFQGVVKDANSDNPLAGVSVRIVEDNLSATTDSNGMFSITASNSDTKSLYFELDDYMFEDQYKVEPSTDLEIKLRKRIKSAATIREESYVANGDCSPDIPNDEDWNVDFEQTDLKGDLAPDNTYTRRDPSAVLFRNGKYYVWYSYSLTNGEGKTAPWDLNDIYYATSEDGEAWTEHGAAVTRGEAGSFDHRSVFTTEIFNHEGKYYLVYQAAKDQAGVYDRNFVGMAHADSPDGPWTKIPEPVLRPTYTDNLWFDNNAVHDPCIIFYENKFRLYYKGECNCFSASGCNRWCNPVCNLGKQVKWGVAIADSPTGPYVKSEMNPITNTGHEVMVWNYNGGVAILQHQDGPEAQTIQFAEDGFNFEIKGSATNLPEAAGLFRPENPADNPHGGIEWGLSHVLKWDVPGGWMHLRRFKKKATSATGMMLQPDTIYLAVNEKRTLEPVLTPLNATNTSFSWMSSDETIASLDASGDIVANKLGFATLTATSGNGAFSDKVVVKVSDRELVKVNLSITAGSFASTGNLTNTGYGEPSGNAGMNRSGNGVNFVNRDDWAKYSVNVPYTGRYYVNYFISTPSDNAQVQLKSGDRLLNQEEVANNGGWDNYYRLPGTNTFHLDAGDQEISLWASGSNDWQWNMSSFSLETEVELNEPAKIKLQEIQLNISEAEIAIDSSFTMTTTLVPTNAEDVELVWSSSNNGIAVVDGGEVSGRSPGSATIKVRNSSSNVEASMTVTVLKPTTVEMIEVMYDSAWLTIDSVLTLVPSITPENPEVIDLKWSSSNSTVATVSEGIVRAIAEGTSKITVLDAESKKEASTIVTVFVPMGPLGLPGQPVLIFPNPATTLLYLPIESTDIKVYDTAGKLLTVNRSKYNGHAVLDVANLNAGIYVVKFRLSGTSYQHRLVKR
ncbi:MAG: Ig-like domain-containing protein [Cyclobacteriaceae bacterium]